MTTPAIDHVLVNARGAQVGISRFGATLVSIRVPDRRGDLGEVLLGYPTREAYAAGRRYFGATIGRCANRIAGARVRIDAEPFALTANDGAHHLHGGARGLHKVEWERVSGSARHLALRRVSPAGEEGYPGALTVDLRLRWNDACELDLEFDASTDSTTLCNLTLRPWFNLEDGGAGDVLEHTLRLQAQRFLPVDATLIPTGERRAVRGTAFDFAAPRAIGAALTTADPQLRLARGFDHCFALRDAPGPMTPVAELRAPGSGRVLEVHTTEPGLQFFSGQTLDGSDVGPAGLAYGRFAGLCLEPQRFPDAPHHADFPTIVLRPGERYQHRLRYVFGAG